MKTHIMLLPIIFLCSSSSDVFSRTSSVDLQWRYFPADGMSFVEQQQSMVLPKPKPGWWYTDYKIVKTLFLTKVGRRVKETLTQYKELCSSSKKLHPIPCLCDPGSPCIPPVPGPIVCPAQCYAAIDNFEEAVVNYLDQANQDQYIANDVEIFELLDLLALLVENMQEKACSSTAYPTYPFVNYSGAAISSKSSMTVTAGGVQDFGFFRKVIYDGNVPHEENLTMEGLLSEFNLALTETACDQLVCLHSAIAYSSDVNKAYIQLAMNSNTNPEKFTRKPLNLAIVLDVSGSMRAKDNTLQSRLEWAKDAAFKTVAELSENDYFSLVVFDTNSEILIEPAPVNDKDSINVVIDGLKTKNSTNLEAGLRDGYKLVSKNIFNLDDSYENRVILITDARLNTGVTEEKEVLQLVTDYASQSVGLTAIGIGANFNHSFIHGITHSRGGNCIFVQSGEEMYDYFNAFNFLVTPVAFNFNALLNFVDIDATLVNAYGIPNNENAPLAEILSIPTLFFAGSSNGGAILLEYDLN